MCGNTAMMLQTKAPRAKPLGAAPPGHSLYTSTTHLLLPGSMRTPKASRHSWKYRQANSGLLVSVPRLPADKAWTVAEYTCFQKGIQEKQGVSAKNLGSKTCCVPTVLRSEGGGGHSHSSQCFTRWPSTQSMDLSRLVKTRQISGNLRQLLAPDIPPQRWD